MTIIQEKTLQKMIKSDYKIQDIQEIKAFLLEKGTLSFSSLDNGLFPAAASVDADCTGYKYVWVRDNIYVDYAHYLSGETEVAIKNLQTLMSYFKKFKFRFQKAIAGEIDLNIAMERPNVRFDGRNLKEVEEPWEHAQNDALGYFLWLYCKLATEVDSNNKIDLQRDDLEMLLLFALYFQTIRYWEDEDSGHWEEGRKIQASSIGVVVAGLKALRNLFVEKSLSLEDYQYQDRVFSLDLLDRLIEKGSLALNRILPLECIQPQPKQRKTDAALLFLIYPLEIVTDRMSEQILSNAIANLQGDYGIRRYLGDSFWCRDFQDLPKQIQTSIYTERQKWLEEKGRAVKADEEAQWCIFDPLVSAIFGRRFQSSQRRNGDFEKQIQYLNRSLGQITGKGNRVKDVEIEAFKCPELYYLQEDRYVPNVSTPLLWTQANLKIALTIMEQNLA